MLVWLFGLYCLLGACTAIAFAAFGAQRVLPQPASISIPARILLLPGAFVLWPYILIRWSTGGSSR